MWCWLSPRTSLLHAANLHKLSLLRYSVNTHLVFFLYHWSAWVSQINMNIFQSLLLFVSCLIKIECICNNLIRMSLWENFYNFHIRILNLWFSWLMNYIMSSILVCWATCNYSLIARLYFQDSAIFLSVAEYFLVSTWFSAASSIFCPLTLADFLSNTILQSWNGERKFVQELPLGFWSLPWFLSFFLQN